MMAKALESEEQLWKGGWSDRAFRARKTRHEARQESQVDIIP